nr:PREDICTED: protein BOLA2-like isoform X2 [Bemisia tabaci]
MTEIEQKVRTKLNAELQPTYLELNDISDGCGSKFQAVIVSEKFVGKSRIERQRLVYTIIADEMKQIHAFSQRTLTPEEWEKEKK